MNDGVAAEMAGGRLLEELIPRCEVLLPAERGDEDDRAGRDLTILINGHPSAAAQSKSTTMAAPKGQVGQLRAILDLEFVISATNKAVDTAFSQDWLTMTYVAAFNEMFQEVSLRTMIAVGVPRDVVEAHKHEVRTNLPLLTWARPIDEPLIEYFLGAIKSGLYERVVGGGPRLEIPTYSLPSPGAYAFPLSDDPYFFYPLHRPWTGRFDEDWMNWPFDLTNKMKMLG